MAAGKARININHKGARQVLTAPGVKAFLLAKAARVADACNAESSWGGYDYADASGVTRARAVVYSTGRNDSEARTNRLSRNLHGGL